MTQQQPTQVPGDTHRRPKSGGVMQRQTREARRMMWWANVDLEIHPSRLILLGSHTWADGNGQVRVPVFIFRITHNEPRLLMILILSTPRKPALRFARHSSCSGDLKPTLCCAGVAVNANGEYAITASTGGGGHSIYVSSPFLRNILDTFRNTNIRDRDPPYPVPSYSSFKLVLC